MLVQFSCANYRSIKDPILFSMVASADNAHKECLIKVGRGRYLRCGEIYGANGSGKTTVVDAMGQMTMLVCNSNNHQPGDKLLRFPHKLATNEPTSFSIIFYKNKTKYAYGFSYDNDSILEESLYYWPNSKKALIFERISPTSFSFSEPFKKASENCQGRLKNNKLLLSCASNETDIQPVNDAFMFFKEDLVFYGNGPNNWLDYSLSQMKDHQDLKEKFLSFMHSIGSDMNDVQIKVENRPVILPGFVGPNGAPIQQFMDIIETKVVYSDFTLDLNEESFGVRSLFQFVIPMLDILTNDKVLVSDELEAHLHSAIIADIIKRFCQNKDGHGQLIMTTHNTDLLDLNIIRRDQIWFTEIKSPSRSTDLYSLVELKNIRKGENIKKGYISGRYGAIPILNSSFSEDIK